MKLISKALVVSALIGLFCFCLPAISNAQLATKISVNQNTDTILMQAQITGLSKDQVSLNLFKQAEIIDFSGLQVMPNGDAGFLLKSTGGNTAQIKYALKIDQSQIQYLTEDQNWYPRSHADIIQTFSIDVKTEKGTEAIHSATGQNESGISIVIGKFIKYVSPSKKIVIYLQNEDLALANTLIQNLDLYLSNDEQKFGPYPYDQFSVVESSDEIGYAFPRMTWIGSQLLRFPFILRTSLPHELLHSWWGNSVFVDYKTGNWCEGLTVFGADYALLNDSEKATYRQKALLEYVDYVKTATEISLSEFVSRGEDKSLQAIGYNKSLMMFVMLEQLVGADTLNKALAIFSQKYKFVEASYANIFEILSSLKPEKESALHNFFTTWILEKGAITFDSLKAEATEVSQGFEIVFSLNNDELKKLGELPVDFSIYFTDGMRQLATLSAGLPLKMRVDKKPQQFTIDPQHKLFRKLSDDERPLTFSKFFAATQVQIQASGKTLETLAAVFPSVGFESVLACSQNLNSSEILMIENYPGGIPEIDEALAKRSVELHPDFLLIDNQKISLAENGYFIFLKVKSQMVILFQTNISLSMNRWFERWSHYGAQGFVVLTPKAAVKQGVWDNPYIQDFEIQKESLIIR